MQRLDAKDVTALLRAAIETGEFESGEPLPTTEELRARFGVGKNTISAAIQALKGEGVLTGVGGGRTRVRARPVHSFRTNERYHQEKALVKADEATRRKNGVAELDANIDVDQLHVDKAAYEVTEPPSDVAAALGIDPTEHVLQRTYTRQHAQGTGFDHHVSYIPYERVKDHPPLLDASNEPWPGGTLHQLYTAGIEVSQIVDHVSARIPTPKETELHDIPFNVPVLAIRKISLDTEGKPVELADLLIPADRISLTYVTPLQKWEDA